jgi:uncharacterized protein
VRAVVDTNVLVSGLRSPEGVPSRIVRLIAVGDVEVCWSASILDEYQDVLRRPKFPFFPEEVDVLLEQIRRYGVWVIPRPLRNPLPDPSDEPFLEVALAANAHCLVTGNLRHYPKELRQGVAVLSPAEFLEYLARSPE